MGNIKIDWVLSTKQLTAFKILTDKTTTELFYGGGAGGGKLLRLSEPIITPKGWTTIGELSVGSVVFDEKGKSCNVIAISGIEKEPILYEFIFDDMSKIISCKDHQWKTYDISELRQLTRLTSGYRENRRKKRKSRIGGKKSKHFSRNIIKRNQDRKYEYKTINDGTIRTTQDIVNTLKKGKRNNHAIPNTFPLNFPSQELLIHPYVLGAWLGDGTSRNGGFTGIDYEIIDRIENMGYKMTHAENGNSHYICGIMPQLKKLELLNNKHIPHQYLFSSYEQRLELLKGLMDTDGTVSKSSGSAEFCNTNKKIINGVYELIVGMGWKANVREGKSKLYNKYCGKKWIIKWMPSVKVFHLKRKRVLQKIATRRTNHFRYIIAVKKVKTEPGVCIMVDSPNNMYLAGIDLIPTHNSELGCGWLIIECLSSPGTRWLMGRARLQSLKQSTLLSFFDICRRWSIKKDEHFKYNGQDNVITFTNGSEIYLKDLFAYPSDPEFDSLGSTEYTGAFIDECSQVTIKAKNIVMSRLRFKLEEFSKVPKLLLASNPSKTFLYYDFYKPWRENRLEPYKKFVPALVQDNPFISEHYIANLNKLDKISKERLLYGNFEYDDDPSVLFEYDKMLDMFNIDVGRDGKGYISVDVARFGADKTVVMVWDGFRVIEISQESRTSTKEVVEIIESKMSKFKVPITRVVIDEDGVGGGVVDNLSGCVGFVNNSRQIENIYGNEPKHLNFSNLKSQCYFMLADMVNNKQISVANLDIDVKEKLIEELEQIKRKDPDKDGKTAVLSKDKIKETLSRSPDFADAMMMRMYFKVNEKEHDFFFG